MIELVQLLPRRLQERRYLSSLEGDGRAVGIVLVVRRDELRSLDDLVEVTSQGGEPRRRA